LNEEIQVNFKQTRKGEREDIIVVTDGDIEFEVHYPADGYDTPYGIALPNEEIIRGLNKDRKAKSLYKKYKSNIENFTNS
jgi:hypothetical protein